MRAIRVDQRYGGIMGRELLATCAEGHHWVVGADELDNLRANLSIVSYRSAANINQVLRGIPEVLECPQCQRAARETMASMWLDPDRLRVEGHAE
jgi:hypothetical protein